MQRVFFGTTGEPVEVLRVTDTAPLPEPKARQVRVRVTARPINPSDLLYIRGQYGLKPELPAWPGFEGSGVVDALGPGVEAPPLGSRVAFAALGTWQEYIVVPAHTLLVVPEGIPDTQSCQLYVNPFTAWALLHEAQLAPGDWLLQSAGGSAFGQLVSQLGHRRGLRVISTVRRDDHRERLQQLGAHAVINTETEPLVQSVREFTKGKGVRAGFDAVGGPLTQQLLECLSPSATLFVYGLLSLTTTPLNLATLIFGQITLRGFWLTEWLREAPQEVRLRASAEILGLVASGHLKLPVEAEYELVDVLDAVAHAELTGRAGKIVLVS